MRIAPNTAGSFLTFLTLRGSFLTFSVFFFYNFKRFFVPKNVIFSCSKSSETSKKSISRRGGQVKLLAVKLSAAKLSRDLKLSCGETVSGETVCDKTFRGEIFGHEHDSYYIIRKHVNLYRMISPLYRNEFGNTPN